MTKYRAEAVIRIYIELDADTYEEADEYLRDSLSFASLATKNTAFLDSVDILRMKETEQEQARCEWCNSRRWSDINGCAECGNLNDRWRD